MSRTICAVATCKNAHYKTKSRVPPVTYYSFPKDPALRNTWVWKCGRADQFNPNTSRICSDHFAEEQFQLDIEAQLMGYTRHRKLIVGAIPTLKLGKNPTPPKKRDLVTQRRERLASRVAREDVRRALEQEIFPMTATDLPSVEDTPSETEPPALICSTCANLSVGTFIDANKTLLSENTSLKTENEALKIVITNLNEELRAKKQELENARNLNCQIEGLKHENNKLTQILSSMFSPSQLEVLKGKKKVHWKAEDIKKAFSLRYLSKRAYLFIKTDFKIPLPAVQTLQKWSSRVNMRKGILNEVLQLVEVAGMQMTEIEKLCIL